MSYQNDTLRVQPSQGVAAAFDQDNLVSAAGLVPVLALADRSGPCGLLAQKLTAALPNAAIQARTHHPRRWGEPFDAWGEVLGAADSIRRSG